MASYFVLKFAARNKSTATNDINSQLAFAYRSLTNFFLPIKIEIVGDLKQFDTRRPAVFICNHQSEMDFAAIGNRGSAIETMSKVAKTIYEKKVGVFMFPEGTRSRQTTNQMLPFKKGAFYLAIQGQIPVIPMVISSYHDLYNIKNRLFEGGLIRIKILPAIETTGMTLEDVDKLTDDAFTKMSEVLVEISDPVPDFAAPLKIPEKKPRKKEQ
ncbi:hypothetical protein HK100_009278 [Physocladia obscura]|uniref:Phospholipid/glycerol acyltransferase domain-containing protein n=1 Tax=Physocladia obscura TaxID=109957 RepID=A0AAD5T669_9FUNG|nr:hypothetical protein HK100_009278 [Physocladia obscura]